MSILSLGSALPEHRKKKSKGRAHASRTSTGDAAPMVLDDLMDEGQPQPCSAFLRCEEGVEDLIGLRRRDACSGISDLHHHAALGSPPRGREPIRVVAPSGP